MEKLKAFIKNNWLWLILIIIILIIGIVLLIQYKNSDGTKEHKIANYELWISSSEKTELIIRFKEEYDVCWQPFKRSICSDKKLTITEFEVINEDLKDIIESTNTSDLTIEEAIILFLNQALEKGIDLKNIKIITDYQFDESFKNRIKNAFKDKELNIEFHYGSLGYTGELKETYTYYTITFDASGGTPIDSIVVKEEEQVPEPTAPTRDGYTFVEWQLNGEKYDFSTPVTEEITLTAIWKETKNESSNNSNNSSNNETNKNTNPYSNKLNLNNNISITEYHVNSGNIDCFYYMFVTNLQEVFPEAKISKIGSNPAEVSFWHNKDRLDTEVSTEEIIEYLNNGTLKINTSKENEFKNTLDKYKNGTYKGIANVSYDIENHRLTFSYDYISFNGLNTNSNGESANKEIQKILSSATKFNGPCGGFDSYQNKTLDEELCSKYNLDCDRW